MLHYISGLVFGHLHGNVVVIISPEVLALNRACESFVLEHLETFLLEFDARIRLKPVAPKHTEGI